MVGEQLHGDGFQDGAEQLRGGRELEDVVGGGAHFLVAFGDDGDHDAVAGLDLADVADGFLVAGDRLRVAPVAGGQHHHRQVLVDEGVGAVLHLSGRVAFGVDVGNLLQLQRPFQRQRVVDAAAQKKKVAAAEEMSGQLFDLVVAVQDLLQLGRNLQQLSQVGLGFHRGQPAAHLGQVERQDVKSGKLRGEGLGGGHADFRPGVGVEGAVGLARNHGADHVANGQGPGAFLLGLALGGDGVGGLARLADDDGQRGSIDQRVAVAVLGGVVHFHRQPRQFLDHELAGQRRMPGGAAGEELDFREPSEVGLADLHLVAQENYPALAADAPQ